MKTSSIIISGIVIGAAGAIAGALFAPGKGSKTRSRIAKKGKQYKDQLADNLDHMADSVLHPFEDLEDKTIRVSQKAIDKAKKIKENATPK